MIWSLLASVALASWADTALGACGSQTGDPMLVRASADTRLMRSHQNANDGASGLMWMKRSSDVRGLVAFDLSCHAGTTDVIDCAELEGSVEHGTARARGNFSAHRMLVPWVEGTQSFNEFRYDGIKYGPFPGTGPGTTWDCRVDPDVSDNTSNGCDPADKWNGSDDCGGGVPCYDPVPATAFYADESQPELTWDVTSHVQGADSVESWLLKVEDETVKSSAAKLYSTDGVRFMADVDPLPGGGAHFDLAPRLRLWGPNLQRPTAVFDAPEGVLLQNPLPARITQQSATLGQPARWVNTTTGEWGEMTADGVSDWVANIPLSGGPNDIEFTVFDACGTEGRIYETVTYGSAEALLCYAVRVTRRTPAFAPVLGHPIPDVLEPGELDLKKVQSLCFPADVDGAGEVAPVAQLSYRARTSSGEPAHVPQSGILLHGRFGTVEAETLRVDSALIPVSVGFGADPAPLDATSVSHACYRARGTAGDHLPRRFQTHVADALEDRPYRLRDLSRVCYPEVSQAGLIEDPGAPLLCYRVSRGIGAEKHRRLRGVLRTVDEFGSLALDTKREAEICVRAERDGV